MPSVLVTDATFSPLDIEEKILQPLSCTIESRQCRTVPALLEVVSDADYVITQFAPIKAEVIRAMTKARLIVRYGIGVDNVDLDAARACGIPVCNVPDYCIDEVADHTLAMILSSTRHVVSHTERLRQGGWGLSVPIEGMKALRDLTVGLVGCGRIGREVVKRLMPFKGRVCVFDPGVDHAEIRTLGAEPVGSLDDILTQADVVSLHCPSTTKTRRMIDAPALARMRTGAILVNLSRGDLVETGALVSALESGQISVAALDVFDPEPIPQSHPLPGLPNVIMTPHIASASPRAVRQLRQSAAEAVARAVRGEPLRDVVNGVDLIHAG